jgi:hypothetical protein
MRIARPWINTFVLAVLVAAAISITSLAYRWYQVDPDGSNEGNARVAVTLTPEDHALVEARDSLSKWLLGLSVTLLPGLIVKKTKTGEFSYQQRLLPLLAGGLLVVSLYGFFLAQHSVTFVLAHGPKYLLYSKFSEFPLVVQFWSLLGAAALLISHWAGLARGATAPLIVGVTLLMSLSSTSQAADAPRSAQESCIRAWSQSRRVALDESQVTMAATVVDGIQRRIGAKPNEESCDFTNTQLDQLRFLAMSSGDDDPEAFWKVLSSVNRDLSSHGAGVGVFLRSLLDSAEVWRSESGLLSIRGSLTGSHVILSGKEVGLTDLDVRISPGTYTVVIVRGGGELFRKSNVEITDNHTSMVQVP